MKFRMCPWLLMVVCFMTVSCGGSDGNGTSLGEALSIANQSSDLDNVNPYVAVSPYALNLKGCATAATAEQSCQLSVLPLVAQVTDTPTVDDIMARVLVSHDWMGARFQEMLAYLPADILTLLKGVTAIVIDDDIRPSYYSTLTGAIYLDPDYLWLTAAEKQTITLHEDPRSDYGSALQFISAWRYVKNNAEAYNYYPYDDLTTERTVTDIIEPLARVLYHELAHANDCIPSSAIAGLDSSLTLLQTANALQPQSISVRLDQSFPLSSQVMLDLAGVMYYGDPPTAAQQAYTAYTVGAEFASDVANDDYSYSNIWEDVAMLFEETMMSYHYGIERDVAYLTIPVSPVSCDDYLVGWGQRGRIGDALVSPRAKFVADELLGAGTLDTFFASLSLSPPTDLVAGQGWCANLDPAAAALLPAAPVSILAAPQQDAWRVKVNTLRDR